MHEALDLNTSMAKTKNKKEERKEGRKKSSPGRTSCTCSALQNCPGQIFAPRNTTAINRWSIRQVFSTLIIYWPPQTNFWWVRAQIPSVLLNVSSVQPGWESWSCKCGFSRTILTLGVCIVFDGKLLNYNWVEFIFLKFRDFVFSHHHFVFAFEMESHFILVLNLWFSCLNLPVPGTPGQRSCWCTDGVDLAFASEIRKKQYKKKKWI